MPFEEKRRDKRFVLNRPVKVQCLDTGRYLAGRSENLSAGGAMLQVCHPWRLTPGQRLRVGVSWSSDAAVLDSTRFIEATVIRSQSQGIFQEVAVSFLRRQALAMVA